MARDSTWFAFLAMYLVPEFHNVFSLVPQAGAWERDEKLLQQNRNRSKVVPTAVIARCLDRWEVPEVTEAHRVEYLIDTNAG